MVLRVGYVNEHFASPLLQFAEVDRGQTFNLVSCPGGTGELIAGLRDDEIDVAIALTDALISGIAGGSNAYKLVGSYVSTPLNWAVVTGKNSKYNSIPDLRGTTLGISRVGSGSQTMAAVMAMQQDWYSDPVTKNEVDTPTVQVNGDIHGLIKSVNDGSTSAFLWEWFTTKPYKDKGEVRFIGSVPTPWPSWLIAAHPSPSRAPPNDVRNFLSILSEYVRVFDSQEKRAKEDVDFIKKTHGYEEEDIKAWLLTVKYPNDLAVIDPKVIVDTLSVLEMAGVVQRPEGGFVVEEFINPHIVRLTEV